jgi:hypothetical protein
MNRAAIEQSAYPLTAPAVLLGLVGGAIAWVVGSSSLEGLALLSLFVSVGLTWRRSEVPILPWVLGMQWIAVVIGHFYEALVGPYPQKYIPGDVEKAMTVSLIGLMVLALGMRIGAGKNGPVHVQTSDASEKRVRVLFWMVIAAYLIDYVHVINPKSYVGLDVIVENVLNCRAVLLMVLWYEVLRLGARFRYLIISFLYVFVPALGGFFSSFKEPVFMLVLVAGAFWSPWDSQWWRKNSFKIIGLVPAAALIVMLAVVWQSELKVETRKAYANGSIGSEMQDRLGFFLDHAQAAFPAIWADPLGGFESVVSRLSYVTFFSRVLDRVPAQEAFANGELLKMALTNTLIPRFLYPDKPALPSDSYYTRRFAGVAVMGGNTSISIGYMAEFYADWGLMGMFLSIFGYGVWMGLVHRGLRAFVRPALLVNGALVVVLLPVASFEHQFIKGFAAINIGFLVVVGLSYFGGPWLKRLLEIDNARSLSRGAAGSAKLGPSSVTP